MEPIIGSIEHTILYRKIGLDKKDKKINGGKQMKKSQKILGTVLLSTMVLTALPTHSFAATKDYNTTGKVQFSEPQSPVDPLDPEQPEKEKPVVPENPGTPTTGPLSIDFASSLDFGQITNEKPANNETVLKGFAKGQVLTTGMTGGKETVANYVQVTDHRSLNSSDQPKGWKLSVKQADNFKYSTLDDLGTGTKITFNEAQLEKEKNNNSTPPSVVKSSFEIQPGTTQKVVGAKVGEGWDTWTYHFGTKSTAAKSIELEVPYSEAKTAIPEKTYQTSIVWTIDDTPENP